MIGASWTNGQPRERHASVATTTASAATGTPASLATEVGFNDSLVGLDDPGRPLGDLVAVVENEHDLAQPHDDLHVVLHEQHRLALVAEAADGLEQVVEERAVHAGGRLVEQDQRRVAHEHPHELDQLLLAVGEIAGVLAGERLELHEREQLPRPALGGGPVAAGHHQQVLERGQLGEDARHLERAAHALHRDLPRFQSVDALAPEEDAAGVAPLEAGDAVEERRLAGAVGTDEAVDPAGLEAQRDAVDRGDAAEALLDAVDLERRRHRPQTVRGSRYLICRIPRTPRGMSSTTATMMAPKSS